MAGLFKQPSAPKERPPPEEETDDEDRRQLARDIANKGRKSTLLTTGGPQQANVRKTTLGG